MEKWNELFNQLQMEKPYKPLKDVSSDSWRGGIKYIEERYVFKFKTTN